MARRYSKPFSGKRFAGDKNACVVHDIDNETDMCKIDGMPDEQLVIFPNTPAGRIDVLLAKGYEGMEWKPCPNCLPKDHLDELIKNCETDFAVDFHAS